MSTRNTSSRREFLQGTLAATGAAAALDLSIARSAHAQGSDVLKVGLVGCGGRGTGATENHLEAAKNLGIPVKVIAIADAFDDNAAKCADGLRKRHPDSVELPADRVFSGLDAYKKVLAAGIDTVILATSPGFRPYHYTAAVEAGKNVFMEKPCTTDAPGYNMLLAGNKIADAKNLKVGVGFQRRHTPSYVETVKKIQDGAIGDVHLLRAYWNGGGIWFRDRKPDQTEMQYQVRNWYHFVWLCGDNICEQHIHNLDVCNWVKGDHPVEANGMGWCVQRYTHKTKETGKGQIYDNHFVEFTYKDGTKLYSQCRHIPNCWSGDGGEKIHGTLGVATPGGSIKFNDNKEWKYQDPNVQVAKGGKGKKAAGFNSMVHEHEDLLTAIVKNLKYNEGHHGATSSMTAVLGRMATYSGQVVKWDDAVAKGPREAPDTFTWDTLPKAMPDANGNYPIPVPGIYKAY